MLSVTGSQVALLKGRLFVVHGGDETSLSQLQLALYKLGLAESVVEYSSSGGKAIADALVEERSPGASSPLFGLVLLTPDDIGHSKNETADKAMPRAGQTVVLALGMLIGVVGQTNVAVLTKGNIAFPLDSTGIQHIPFNDHLKEAKLVEYLQKSGFQISAGAKTGASP